MNTRINFNGREYGSVDEMPADVRQAYQQVMGMMGDANQDGMPDLFQQGGNAPAFTMATSQIIFEGKSYTSVDQLPPEARAKYQSAMSALDADRDGTPDVLESMGGLFTLLAPGSTPATGLNPASPPANASTPPHVAPQAYEPAGPDMRLLVAGAIIAVLLLVVVGLVAVFVLGLPVPGLAVPGR